MLAALTEHFAVHVVVLEEVKVDNWSGTLDVELFAACASCTQMRDPSVLLRSDIHDESNVPFDIVHATPGEIPSRVARLREDKKAVAVFMFDFNTCVIMRSVLAQLQPAYLDLDELLSKKQGRFIAIPTFASYKNLKVRDILQLYRLLERQLIPLCAEVFVSSEVEAANLEGLVPQDRVTVLPNATRWSAPLPAASAGSVQTILFVGSLDYFPNVDGVEFFLHEVWPRLRARYGDNIRFHVVGSRAAPSFTLEGEGVVFERNLNDLLPAYRDASIAIAPIRSGGGTRIKILEAFALGRPVVSMTVGAEGLAVESGRHLLIADEPAAFAEACQRLLDDPLLAARLRDNAAAYVQAHHSAQAVKEALAHSALVRDRDAR